MVKKLVDQSKKIAKGVKTKAPKTVKIKPPSRVSQVVLIGGGQRPKLVFKKLDQGAFINF
jgi:hypothetical protein